MEEGQPTRVTPGVPPGVAAETETAREAGEATDRGEQQPQQKADQVKGQAQEKLNEVKEAAPDQINEVSSAALKLAWPEVGAVVTRLYPQAAWPVASKSKVGPPM